MASIFLSYSREDKTCAERVARVLEDAGHRVWWDRHIASGHEFAPEIEAALENADLVLVAWSKNAAKSPWVRDEAAIGRDSGRLLPVVIDKSQPPIGFRQFQSLDLSGWKGRAGDPRTDGLLEAVEARLSGAASRTPVRTRTAAPGFGRRAVAAAAALALIVLAAVALLVLRPRRAEAEPASLAVLPFRNLSGDRYFAEGVAEEILNQLAREPQFKVAGRTSSALFKDAADLRDVGRRLHVAYVLEGSVRSAGDQVRVDVSLVDTEQGMRLWSRNFRGSLNDIFAIQDNVAQQVAAHLKRELIRTAVPGSTTTRGDVYSLYVTARSLIRTREPAKLATAVELLDRAVKIDPNYAPAWAGLAQASYMAHSYGGRDDPRTAWVKANELGYANRAIAIAPDLAAGHAVMWLLLSSPNVPDTAKQRARAELEKAVKLDPMDSQNWRWLSLQRERDLDFEGALVAARKAAEIDPFFVFNGDYVRLAWTMGERPAAVRFLRYWAESHPEPYKREQAIQVLAGLRNDWSGVYRQVKKARDLAPADVRPNDDAAMGLVLGRLGLIEEAKPYVEPLFIGLWLGTPPPREELGQMDPQNFWRGPLAPLVGRVLLNNGRAADLVSLYDRAFPSPEAMLRRMDKSQFVKHAPVAAAALREAGRNGEAIRLLTTSDRLCAAAMRRGRTPVSFQVDCSRSWAMLGRGDEAIGALNKGLKAGWRPEDEWSYAFVDEPVYRAIRNDPRLERLGRVVLAENERERRELQAAGL